MGFSHLYASYFLLYSTPLYSFTSLFFTFNTPLHVPFPLTIFFTFSPSLCLNVSESCCPLINVLDFSDPRLSVSLSRSHTAGEEGLLFLIKAPAPELTQHATKFRHHSHPWEPINNSACCPIHHHARRYVCTVLYSWRALIHGKRSYSLRTNSKEKMANTSL